MKWERDGRTVVSSAEPDVRTFSIFRILYFSLFDSELSTRRTKERQRKKETCVYTYMYTHAHTLTHTQHSHVSIETNHRSSERSKTERAMKITVRENRSEFLDNTPDDDDDARADEHSTDKNKLSGETRTERRSDGRWPGCTHNRPPQRHSTLCRRYRPYADRILT